MSPADLSLDGKEQAGELEYDPLFVREERVFTAFDLHECFFFRLGNLKIVVLLLGRLNFLPSDTPDSRLEDRCYASVQRTWV
jgi:hypothetical protein